MAVITVSREFASGGDAIAARLCEHLNYAYFDKQLMIAAAEDVGLCERDVIDFSEEEYRVRGFVSRLLRGRPHEADLGALTPEEAESARLAVTSRTINEEQCIELVRYTVLSAYDAGNVVIVGRGGQAILRDKPGVLHVRIIAPLDKRIANLQTRGVRGINAIKHMINERDAATWQYLKRFYDIDWRDPAHYHLVLNAAQLTPEHAVAIIATAVEQLPTPAIV